MAFLFNIIQQQAIARTRLSKVLVSWSMCIQSIFSPAKPIANPTDVACPTDMVTFNVIPHPGGLTACMGTVRAGPQSTFAHFSHLRPDQCFWKGSIILLNLACLLVLAVFVISRLVYLVGIETAAELVTYWTRVSSGLCVGGFDMFPQPCSDPCGPATWGALPPTTLTPHHQSPHFSVQLAWR